VGRRHTAILTATNENSEIRCRNLVATQAHPQYELVLIRIRKSQEDRREDEFRRHEGD
jgi:hypothetical protein